MSNNAPQGAGADGHEPRTPQRPLDGRITPPTGTPPHHNSVSTLGWESPSQEDLKETIREELWNRVFELELAEDVKRLVPPQDETVHNEGRFDALLARVLKRVEKADMNLSWCKANIKPAEHETYSYASLVKILNLFAKALDETLKDNAFHKFSDHWDLLKFFIYDREVEFAVDGANPLKPDVIALAANVWKEKQATGKIFKVGWHEGLLVSEVKDTWEALFLQAAMYARGLFDALYPLFVPMILFNYKDRAVQIAIFSRAFTILTPVMDLSTDNGFQIFVMAFIHLLRWTKLSRNPHFNGRLIFPEAQKFDYGRILALRLSVFGTCKRVSKFTHIPDPDNTEVMKAVSVLRSQADRHPPNQPSYSRSTSKAIHSPSRQTHISMSLSGCSHRHSRGSKLVWRYNERMHPLFQMTRIHHRVFKRKREKSASA